MHIIFLLFREKLRIAPPRSAMMRGRRRLFFVRKWGGEKEKGKGGDLLSSPTSLSHPFSLGLGQGAEEEGIAKKLKNKKLDK